MISNKHPLRRRRVLAAAIGVALLAGAASWTMAAKGTAKAPLAPVASAGGAAGAAASLSVAVVAPQRIDLSRTIAASGSVAAKDELVIGSDATGVRLTEVLVDTGSVVRRGQLLARGDDTQLQAQAQQQDAQIRQAKAELAQATANLDRAEQIRDAGVYSTEALQTRRTAAESAAARLQLAQAQRGETEVRIFHTRVLAPADGVIAKRSATVGAVVQPGNELFRLIRDGQLEWLAELPGHALAEVKPGAAVRVQVADGHRIQARVRMVEPTIDPHSRNGRVRVALPAGTALKAGAHADGEIATASASMLTLPESVVFSRDGHPFVWLLDETDTARLTRIETGLRQRGLVEVTRGVAAGARVVSIGAGFVKDGERVRVAADPVPSAGAARAAAPGVPS